MRKLTFQNHRSSLTLSACCILAVSIARAGAQIPPAPTRAERYSEQQQKAQHLYKAGQLAAYAAHLQAMSEEYPYKSNLLPRLAVAYVQLGREENANQSLQRFAQMGGT